MPKVEELTVNGARCRIDEDGDRDLLNVLRDVLGLTGTKYGCGEGSCGACTVLVGGRPVKSCVTRVEVVADREITTIEGLADEGDLHPIQRAFLEHEALQCGYCTPGMVMAAAGLLSRHPEPTDEQIVIGLRGNICRCGTYSRIVAAIRDAADALKMKGAAR